ncbi:MAG: hypothetical protein OEM39_07505, partial [Acidimicrobiia bacterium]|nr:hypothetical protein [Acidimicrobiia bacterium]
MRPLSGIISLLLVVSACTGPDAVTTTTLRTTTTVGRTNSTTTGLLFGADHPIQISGTNFVDTRTGQVFVPRGANYLTRVFIGRGYEDRGLSPAVFDPDRTGSDFDAL